MAKTENISIKGLIQKQQLDNLNKSAEEQVQVLKNIEAHIQDMDMSTGRLETTEEKSLKLAQETARQEKKDREDAIKQAKVDSANRIKEAIANTSAMTQIALNTKTYKGPIEKIGDKFSSVSNTLNTLGIVKKGTGGIVSNFLERRDDKKEFITAQQTYESKKSKSELAKDYEESQKIAKLIAKNEAIIKKQRGTVKESDFLNTVAGSKLGNRRNELASKFSSLDLRNKSKNNKEYEPSVEPIKMSAPIGTPTVIPTESHEDKTERQLQESKTQDILEKIEVNTRPEVVPTNPKEAGKSEGSGGLLGGLGLLVLLKSLKNLIGGIFESIGTALMTAFRLLFNPSIILKGLMKGFALGTLIFSIFKGFKEGFEEWQKTGDIGKAIVEGLGAMVETLTFGLISEEKYKEYAKWFNGKVDEYIITPITNFISHVCDLFDEWIATPIKNAFASIGKFFSETMDSFMSLIQGIGIPEIDISSVSKYIPGAPDKLGPWYPFADSATKESPKPVPKGANNVTPEATPTTSGTKYIPYNRDNANIVHQKSEENIGRKEDMNAKGAGSTIVSAPSSTINNQTVNKNITRLPPTNQHGPYVKINQVGW